MLVLVKTVLFFVKTIDIRHTMYLKYVKTIDIGYTMYLKYVKTIDIRHVSMFPSFFSARGGKRGRVNRLSRGICPIFQIIPQ